MLEPEGHIKRPQAVEIACSSWGALWAILAGVPSKADGTDVKPTLRVDSKKPGGKPGCWYGLERASVRGFGDGAAVFPALTF